MSFSRLNSDTCTYKTNLRQSVGVGNYFIGQPRQDCQACLSEDTNIQAGGQHIGPIEKGIGGATCKNVPLVDMNSELLGITRPASNCPTHKYQKKSNVNPCHLENPRICRGIKAEDTRMSNPPCTLRGTGWNRWEWLCTNPQENVFAQFDYNISYRIVAKDNHRPNIPQPINQAQVLPPLNHSDEPYVSPWMHCQSRKTEEPIPSVHWRNCNTLQQLTNGCYK